MRQRVDPLITPWRATVAYVAAFIAGSLAIATITFVSGLIENGYNPSRDRHLFVARFIFPFLVAGIVSLTVLAPLLSPLYAFSIIAIQRGFIRRWWAFIGLGTAFASMGWMAVSAYHCIVSTCSPLSLASISHVPFTLVAEIVAIGVASGIACRCVLFR